MGNRNQMMGRMNMNQQMMGSMNMNPQMMMVQNNIMGIDNIFMSMNNMNILNFIKFFI